jgi:membrane protein insertase Oxa1/YidC/SpoIIIJ
MMFRRVGEDFFYAWFEDHHLRHFEYLFRLATIVNVKILSMQEKNQKKRGETSKTTKIDAFSSFTSIFFSFVLSHLVFLTAP